MVSKNFKICIDSTFLIPEFVDSMLTKFRLKIWVYYHDGMFINFSSKPVLIMAYQWSSMLFIKKKHTRFNTFDHFL